MVEELSFLTSEMSFALFVLLQHGSHGVPGDLSALSKLLSCPIFQRQCKMPEKYSVQVWETHVNARRRTDDGTLQVADRLANELLPALRLFVEKNSSADRRVFSCVGHSYGGVILREVIVRVAAAFPVSHAMEFGFFAAVSSPHCGIELMNKVMKLGAWLIGKVYSTTYLELLASEGYDVLTNRLLDDDHIMALERFRDRTLVGATAGDVLVPFSSATLCHEPISMYKDELHPVTQPSLPGDCADEVSTSQKNYQLEYFYIGKDHGDTSVAGELPFPINGRPDRKIAAALRCRISSFRIIPVKHTMPNAHNAIIENGWFYNRGDVTRAIAALLFEVSLSRPGTDDQRQSQEKRVAAVKMADRVVLGNSVENVPFGHAEPPAFPDETRNHDK